MYATHPIFFTATIKDWILLLRNDKYKMIVIDSLSFLVKQKRIKVYGFVIMPNHIHLIWQIREGHTKQNVQRDFLKFTAQQIRFDLIEKYPMVLKKFEVNLRDRKYQFWQNRPLSVELYSENVLEQKLDYIHNNPIQERWNLCTYPEKYEYSSAEFYYCNTTKWDFLSHYKD